MEKKGKNKHVHNKCNTSAIEPMEEKLKEIILRDKFPVKTDAHRKIGEQLDEAKIVAVLALLRSEIEKAMPEKYIKGFCNNSSANHLHGDKEIPVNFWNNYHDQYNAMVDEYRANLRKALERKE